MTGARLQPGILDVQFRLSVCNFNQVLGQPNLPKVNLRWLGAYLKPGGFTSLQNLCEKGIQGLRRSPILLKILQRTD